MESFEIYRSSRPQVGTQIDYLGRPYGLATSVDGALCWVRKYGDTGFDQSLPFIWCFRDGVNALHDWPGKDKSVEAFCPGKARLS